MLGFLSIFLSLNFFIWIDSDVLKNSTLSKEQLLYFRETAYYNQNLYRWEKTILLEVKGNPSKADVNQLNDLIAEINPYLADESQIVLVRNNGNLIFHFEKDLLQFDDNPAFKGEKIPLGFMKPVLNKDQQFVKAEVYINPTIIAQKRNEVLRHELCHALGLMAHSHYVFESINLLGKTIFKDMSAYEKSYSSKNFPTLDKMAIKFLYQDVKSLKYSKKEFERDYSRLNKYKTQP